MNKKGMSVLEYAMFVAVLVAALLSMQMYMKRGLQGKFRQAADEIGEQYDPETTTGNLNLIQQSQSITVSNTEDLEFDDNVLDTTTTTTEIVYDILIRNGEEHINAPNP